MNQIIKINDIHNASNEQLKQELGRALEITADYIRYLASIWRELERRGEDLSSLRHGLLAYLPMIANNKVDPRLIINYAGQKTLLAALTNLPLKEQIEIAESGYVSVARLNNDEVTEVQVKVSTLKSDDIYRVFSDDGIRSLDEQRKILTMPAKESPLKKHVTHIVHFDKQNNKDVMIISGKRVYVSTVIKTLFQRYTKEEIAVFLEDRIN